ncbi:MAG: hypothetical protein HY717_14020 [Planctomycetes bacterium]|nr:hypothetical protein [Planctomycetota bacterium]
MASGGPAFKLGFSGPEFISGAAGSIQKSSYFCALSHNLLDALGVSDWVINAAAKGGALTGCSMEGTNWLSLGGQEFVPGLLTTGPGNEDAAAAGVAGQRNIPLGPQSAMTLVRFDFEVTIPQGEGAARLKLVPDGLERPGMPSFPVPTRITSGGVTFGSILGDKVVRLQFEPPGGRQIPGNCNQDGILDLSDALCIFGVHFLGQPAKFPCGDGTAFHAANLALLDWQPDGQVDISDGVALLQFLFLGGPAHPLALPGNPTVGCIAIPDCPPERVMAPRYTTPLAFKTALSTHSAPPSLPEPPTLWAPIYTRIAEDDDLPWRTLEEVAEAARSFLTPVLKGQSGNWDPTRWTWRPEVDA